MDFKLTPEQETKRKEYYKVCADLLKKQGILLELKALEEARK